MDGWMDGWMDRQIDRQTDNNTTIKRQKVSPNQTAIIPAVSSPLTALWSRGDRHNAFHYLARYSFGTKIGMFNYEGQAAEWYSLDRIFNDFYCASDKFFFQPVCTLNKQTQKLADILSSHSLPNSASNYVTAKHMQNNPTSATYQTAVNTHSLTFWHRSFKF